MRFFISIPLSQADRKLETAVADGFNPEIRMTRTDFLFSLSGSGIEEIAGRIERAGAKVLIHGPFFGLDIASMDRHISEFSADCLMKGIEVTAALGGRVMVVHTGYVPLFSKGGRRHWMRNWGERSKPIIEKASDCGVTIALENTWDDRPEILLRLRELSGSDNVKFCLDTGHVNCFSRLPLRYWWEAIGKNVRVIHLHDNFGDSDDHNVPGNGTFDFNELGGYLKNMKKMPLLDLEVSWEEREKSREYLSSIFWPSANR